MAVAPGAVFKSATSVQDELSQDSVTKTGPLPPKIKAAAVVPEPPKPDLAVFTSATSVQDVPLYCSTTAVLPGADPVDSIAAVCVPA